ncbi:MAG TPA: hypothetical protein VFS23_27940 [Vicinamibacterales bacterium]|nr:hypothetical protein [Vicinamibacterales bacterium]
MDRTRLDSSIVEMAAADAAYDAALRKFAEATRRATQQPGNAAATRELQLADASLAQARTRVTAARVALDDIRIDELATLETSDLLLGSIAGHQVLSLFPVALEARLEPGRLRVRIWPDSISTSTHDPRLTEKELTATKTYWRAQAAATTDEASRVAWSALADEIGVTRAAWSAQVLTPSNRSALAPGVEPVFPTVSLQDDAAPFVPRAAVLPDRWIAIGIRGIKREFERVGAPIPMDLAVGLDTTPSEAVALANREGEPIQLPPRMRWMTDFALAVQVGMALDVPLAADVDRLDYLLVFGVRLTQTPQQNADTLAGLFTGHRFSRGLAFVPQGTPTNNSSAGGSGFPSRSERISAAFDLERRPRTFLSDHASNGVTTARAFGLAADLFASIPASGATAQVTAEPDGFEPEAASLMQTVLWQVTLGGTLEDFFGLPDARVNNVREYFRQHVRAAGPVPAIRVGRQPYGVLPVTTINEFVAAPAEGIDPRLIRLLGATRTWLASLRQGDFFAGDPEQALRQLGRSVHLFSEVTPQNPNSTGENRWATLARMLAVNTRNSISDNWRTSQMRRMVEAVPQPVTRPIVDGATSAELTALATALPAAILSRPVPTSVLGRMVRQAALLEWSRFARVVCNATLDIPSREDLGFKAATSGSDVYINAVVTAMLETPSIPIQPFDPGVIRREPVRARRIDDDPREPPDPEEPEDPRDPRDPPPPPGEPEVTAAERQKIRTMVGSLAQPLATCPGAARLASFRQALTRLATFPLARLEFELFGVLDICNHRLDAWFSSLATCRLATLRAATPLGAVIGGWGCLQDVRRSDPANPQQRAEYIHTPSLDQAAAAAVLRSGARRAHRQGSQHADIDLSSRRVRLARWVLEGVRNGRSLSELLGVRFERAVKGTPTADAQLTALRRAFPGAGAMGVLDGLALQQAGLPASSSPDMVRGATAINETLDAVADALTAEAVYQIVKGNPVGALINVEAIAEGSAPPDLRVTETPASGIRLTHRVVVALPANAKPTGWQTKVTPRSRAEPLLDAWCGLLLGPAADVAIVVEGAGAATVSVKLSTLGVAAIDVVLSGRDRGSELAELVIRAASSSSPGLSGARVREDRGWKDLVGLCGAIARVLTHGENLRPESFDPPSVMAPTTAEDFGDLSARVTEAGTALSALRDALAAGTDPAGAALRAAAFGIRVPGLLLGSSPTGEQQGALLAAVEARLLGAMSGTPRDRLRALFGGDLPGVVTFTPRDPAMLATTGSPQPVSLLAGNTTAPQSWLDAAARAHPKVAALAEVLLRREAIGSHPAQLLIAQAPWVDGDRWIATSFTSASKRPPAGRLSVVINAPAGLPAAQPVGGLLIDAWTETIPAPTRDTAMALRFNNASTRAPQVILLAVSPNPAQPWTTTTLVDVLLETLTITRLRMQPPGSFSSGGLMPFALLGQRPGNTGMSFSL